MNFLQTLFDAFKEALWPFRMVQQWELGGLYRLGRFKKVVGPGVYFVIPWFWDLETLASVPAIVSTPRLDVTLRDGTVLTFAVSATMQVMDFNRAFNTIDQYQETAVELLTAVVSDRLMEVDPARLAPDGQRKRLLTDLTRWVQEESSEFGIQTQKIRFSTFILKARAFRLLGDVAGAAW